MAKFPSILEAGSSQNILAYSDNIYDKDKGDFVSNLLGKGGDGISGVTVGTTNFNVQNGVASAKTINMKNQKHSSSTIFDGTVQAFSTPYSSNTYIDGTVTVDANTPSYSSYTYIDGTVNVYDYKTSGKTYIDGVGLSTRKQNNGITYTASIEPEYMYVQSTSGNSYSFAEMRDNEIFIYDSKTKNLTELTQNGLAIYQPNSDKTLTISQSGTTLLDSQDNILFKDVYSRDTARREIYNPNKPTTEFNTYSQHQINFTNGNDYINKRDIACDGKTHGSEDTTWLSGHVERTLQNYDFSGGSTMFSVFLGQDYNDRPRRGEIYLEDYDGTYLIYQSFTASNRTVEQRKKLRKLQSSQDLASEDIIFSLSGYSDKIFITEDSGATSGNVVTTLTPSSYTQTIVIEDSGSTYYHPKKDLTLSGDTFLEKIESRKGDIISLEPEKIRMYNGKNRHEIFFANPYGGQGNDDPYIVISDSNSKSLKIDDFGITNSQFSSFDNYAYVSNGGLYDLDKKQDALTSSSTIATINGKALTYGGSITIDTVTVDTEMSSGSTNPVQNKVIKAYVDNSLGDINTILTKING